MRNRVFVALVIAFGSITSLAAQTANVGIRPPAAAAARVIATESMPLEAMPGVKNAPFSADAVTEFTQVLGDGNRIERRYSATIARDSQGRTRRDEEIALVGPLAVDGATPRLVTIVDPVAEASFTLDERQRVAFRSPVMFSRMRYTPFTSAMQAGWAIEHSSAHAVPQVSVVVPNQSLLITDAAASKLTQESLGTRMIEGVRAEGTRTTSTIPAGAIGNVMPIEVITERWHSADLQMAVLISRRDPRSGDSVYRLTNVVRAEPPSDLFTIPPDYEVRQGEFGGRVMKKLDTVKDALKKGKEQ